jgi:hypothetical protein
MSFNKACFEKLALPPSRGPDHVGGSAVDGSATLTALLRRPGRPVAAPPDSGSAGWQRHLIKKLERQRLCEFGACERQRLYEAHTKNNMSFNKACFEKLALPPSRGPDHVGGSAVGGSATLTALLRRPGRPVAAPPDSGSAGWQRHLIKLERQRLCEFGACERQRLYEAHS